MSESRGALLLKMEVGGSFWVEGGVRSAREKREGPGRSAQK